jgi:hypothetical protein
MGGHLTSYRGDIIEMLTVYNCHNVPLPSCVASHASPTTTCLAGKVECSHFFVPSKTKEVTSGVGMFSLSTHTGVTKRLRFRESSTHYLPVNKVTSNKNYCYASI